MPIGDIAGELLGGALRAVGSVIVEVVLEIAIRGPGYLICRQFKSDIDPDGGWVVVVGVMFWVILGVIGYVSYSYLWTQLAMDRCLDSGGAFNDQTHACTRDQGQ